MRRVNSRAGGRVRGNFEEPLLLLLLGLRVDLLALARDVGGGDGQALARKRLDALRSQVRVVTEVDCVGAHSVRRGLHDFGASRNADLLVSPRAVATSCERGEGAGRRTSRTLSAFEAVPPPLYARDVWNVEDEIEEAVEKALALIAALGGVDAHAEFADHAVDGLRRFGGTVDLLVIGAHRYRPIEHVVERSISQRLADKAPCPVLVLASSARRRIEPAKDQITRSAQ